MRTQNSALTNWDAGIQSPKTEDRGQQDPKIKKPRSGT